MAAFVEQSDVVMASLTVRENMRFYATLKLAHLSEQTREDKINSLLRDLGLEECADVRCGGGGEGGGGSKTSGKRTISGGQKRRLSLAVAMLTDPEILFADEVTSGLDAATSLQIANLLRKLAGECRAILCS